MLHGIDPFTHLLVFEAASRRRERDARHEAQRRRRRDSSLASAGTRRDHDLDHGPGLARRAGRLVGALPSLRTTPRSVEPA